MHTYVHAALFTIAETWNQPKCPLTVDWTRKIWHIYTMEYYAAIKYDEFVSSVGTWMNLETILLSKLTQEQEIKHHTGSVVGVRGGTAVVGMLRRDNMGRNARYR